MNLDFALVNRALLNIGMAPLGETDKQAKNEAWLTAKDYFLTTMLEALAQVEWTGAKRRRELCPALLSHKGNAAFAYIFDLPIDCAKHIELDGQAYYEVEGDLLYTDATPARLLYVSNGRRLIDQPVISGGNARRRPAGAYVTGGDAGRVRRYEAGDNFITAGGASSKRIYGINGSITVAPPPEADEDFPDYREQHLEPNFYLYWENLLSSKYALRLTDKPDLSMAYFNKAMAIGKAAELVSVQHSAGKRKAADTWQEELGLS